MHTEDWSDERKAAVTRSYEKRITALHGDPRFRAKLRRADVAADLAIAVALSNLPRSKVAEKARMKPSQLCRQLDGDTNLTLDSISRIAEALGYEFDVVLRKASEPAARQPWSRRPNRTVLVEIMRQHTGSHYQLTDMHVMTGQALNEVNAANEIVPADLLAA